MVKLKDVSQWRAKNAAHRVPEQVRAQQMAMVQAAFPDADTRAYDPRTMGDQPLRGRKHRRNFVDRKTGVRFTTTEDRRSATRDGERRRHQVQDDRWEDADAYAARIFFRGRRS